MLQKSANRITRDCTMELTVVRARLDNANPLIRFLLCEDMEAGRQRRIRVRLTAGFFPAVGVPRQDCSFATTMCGG
jgi:hypothetical protein